MTNYSVCGNIGKQFVFILVIDFLQQMCLQQTTGISFHHVSVLIVYALIERVVFLSHCQLESKPLLCMHLNNSTWNSCISQIYFLWNMRESSSIVQKWGPESCSEYYMPFSILVEMVGTFLVHTFWFGYLFQLYTSICFSIFINPYLNKHSSKKKDKHTWFTGFFR